MEAIDYLNESETNESKKTEIIENKSLTLQEVITILEDTATYNRIKNYLLKLKGSNSPVNGKDLDDIVQDTLLKAFNHAKKHKGFSSKSNAKYFTFLYVIAKNSYFNESKRKTSRGERSMLITDENGNDLDMKDILEDKRPDPLVTAIAKETYQKVEEVLKELTESQRRSLILQLEGNSIEEIAQITDTTPGTVKSRIHRGKKRLYKILGSSLG